MVDQPYPGDILKEDVLDCLDLTVTDAAERLGMSRVSLSRVLNGEAGISPDLAIRLEQAGITSARFWMNLQTTFDLDQAAKRPQPAVVAWRAHSP